MQYIWCTVYTRYGDQKIHPDLISLARVGTHIVRHLRVVPESPSANDVDEDLRLLPRKQSPSTVVAVTVVIGNRAHVNCRDNWNANGAMGPSFDDLRYVACSAYKDDGRANVLGKRCER